ncbi:MAG: LacI family DNA-binding transcriptional regulator [Verrucomicrobiae bacterium]|nr:LacI family DNA-binding transcriptional regulator [Verrucomicrobiae bacterium]
MSAINQIAEKTRLSYVTVAEILRGRKGYNAKTCQRVLKLARELNYQPNYLGKALAGGRSMSIGVIISSLDSPIEVGKLKEIEFQASANGYRCYLLTHHSFLFAQPADAQPTLADSLNDLIQRRIDGLMVYVVHPLPREVLAILRKATIPVVHIDWAPPEAQQVIRIERQAALRDLAKHLAGLGHRRAVFHQRAPGRMIQPLQKALRKENLHLEAPPEWSTTGHSPDFETQACALASERFRQGDVPPLLICHLDQAAVGVLAACHDAGLKVPQDISLVGWGGLPCAQTCRPQLTTVREPGVGVGEQAFKWLDMLMRKTKDIAGCTTFAAHLTIASTTGQCAGGIL